MVNSPDLVILDELTVGLDIEQKASLYALIRSLGDAAGILRSTHATDDVIAMADAVIALGDGSIRFQGSASDFYGTDAARPDGDAVRDRYRTVLGRPVQS